MFKYCDVSKPEYVELTRIVGGAPTEITVDRSRFPNTQLAPKPLPYKSESPIGLGGNSCHNLRDNTDSIPQSYV